MQSDISMGNDSKSLWLTEDFRPSSQSETMRTKIVCVKKLTILRFVCEFHQFFSLNFKSWCPPPLGDGGVLILKSSNHWRRAFLHHMGRQVHIGEVILVTKDGGGSIQVKTIIIL